MTALKNDIIRNKGSKCFFFDKGLLKGANVNTLMYTHLNINLFRPVDTVRFYGNEQLKKKYCANDNI